MYVENALGIAIDDFVNHTAIVLTGCFDRSESISAFGVFRDIPFIRALIKHWSIYIGNTQENLPNDFLASFVTARKVDIVTH